MNKTSILEKKLSSFKEASLTMLETTNYPGGSRVSFILSNTLHSVVRINK